MGTLLQKLVIYVGGCHLFVQLWWECSLLSSNGKITKKESRPKIRLQVLSLHKFAWKKISWTAALCEKASLLWKIKYNPVYSSQIIWRKKGRIANVFHIIDIAELTGLKHVYKREI